MLSDIAVLQEFPEAGEVDQLEVDQQFNTAVSLLLAKGNPLQQPLWKCKSLK